MFINFLRGALMALADSVPGVSGGTIAFILGFYDDFINSLNSLVSKSSIDEKKSAIRFLLKLGLGWVCTFILAILFISAIFEKNIYSISSLFIGFIIFSIPIVYKEEKEEIVGKYKNSIYLVIGIIFVIALSYFNPSTGSSGMDLSINSLSIGVGIYTFIAGMIAICAMVLPGISGSTILLIFGLYAPIVNAVKEVITFNFDYLPIVIIFGLGVLSGIACTIKLLRYLLINHRSQIVYMIIGLMIGSIYAVVVGPTTLKVPLEPMSLETFSIVFFIIGGLLIVGLEKLKMICNK